MHPWQTFIPLLAGVALYATPLVAAPTAPSNEKIAAFSAAFEKAWKAGDREALLALHDLDSLPEATRDRERMYWSALIEQNKTTPKGWGGTTFLSRAEAAEAAPGRNPKAYASMVEERVVNGRRYVPVPEPAGFLTVKIWGESGVVFTIGFDPAGKLKISDFAPAPESDPKLYTLPAPIPVQRTAKTPPTPEAIQRFSDALKNDPNTDLTEAKGAPLDLFDYQTHQRRTMAEPGWKVTEVTFTPIGETSKEEEMSSFMLEATKPQQWGERWYGFNLPIAGFAKITLQPEGENQTRKRSRSSPVGITPEGELRFPSLVPVMPPESTAP